MQVGAKQGAALIAVLWILTIMGTITMLFSRQANMSLKINRNVMDGAQASLLAEAGIERGIAELVKDDQETTSDHLKESWSDNQTSFGDVQLGRGIYRVVHQDPDQENLDVYGLVDECSKLNINVADKNMLQQLPNMTEDVADSILDWVDSDSNPRPLGAEIDYYQSLPEPYMAKNGNFDTVDELLLVKGMTLELLYGEDTNHNGILDTNENDGAQSYPLDNQDGILDRGWYPYITVYSYEKNVSGNKEQRVNINSADLETMREKLGKALTDVEINTIISTRQQNNFQSVGDLLSVQPGGGGNSNNNSSSNTGAITKEKLRQIIDLITVTDDQKLVGRINVNTVPATVLKCLVRDNDQLVQNILEYRRSGSAPFDDIGELLDVQGMTDNVFRQLTQWVGTKSSVFSARSIGYVANTKAYKEIYAILDRGADTPQIRYWKEIR